MCKYIDGSLFLEEDKSKSLLEIIPDNYFARGQFEILSEEDEEIDIQSIVEFILPTTYLDEEAETMYVRGKINELIKAVKQLDKNKEDK